MVTKETFLNTSKIYNGPEGRYNYYPRISNWNSSVLSHEWFGHLTQYENESIDLYIHIPFCKKFCYFCGCNVKTSSTKETHLDYIQTLISEWKSYKKFGFKIENLYFGGGTPNSLTIEDFTQILNTLAPVKNIHLEYDPRFHDIELLRYLKSKGLKTISMGIQDANEEVLAIIGRETNFEKLKISLQEIEALELENVNVDFIFGLPKQDLKSIEKLSLFLKENTAITSISLFPFAEVPWFKDFYPGWDNQKLNALEKSKLQFKFIDKFINFQFNPVSFGFFVKEKSKYDQLHKNNLLTRNIMGFSAQRRDILIGLGVSSISHTPKFFKQNHKIFDHYMSHYDEFNNSHSRSKEELEVESSLIDISSKQVFSNVENDKLSSLIEDGLVIKNDDNTFSTTQLGRLFTQYIPKYIHKSI